MTVEEPWETLAALLDWRAPVDWRKAGVTAEQAAVREAMKAAFRLGWDCRSHPEHCSYSVGQARIDALGQVTPPESEEPRMPPESGRLSGTALPST